ncbi:MAG: RelA/SpoT family protein [Prevotella sp.]|nr:RelA/SpoT family protein [Prevotella sp.]
MTEDNIRNDEERLVDEAFQRLLNSYLASPHRKKVDIITKAFNFARQAHKGVKRLSGEPYIMHPLAVAQIASEEMGLGSTSICSALLHDVVEDTDYNIEDIENLFGAKVAQIVDGLTKISGGIFGEHASAQAENFKKLLLTMNDDIRVILIKICDRLHNMRTLDAQPHNKQYKIAGETLYIYAPLANRLGLNKIKTELENLSFRFEHPDTYNYISKKLDETRHSIGNLFDNFTQPIREALDSMGVRYTIKARVKSPYSIWSKMQAKHVTFEEIYDILAVRIIYAVDETEDEIDECFRIYVAISKLYKAHPDRLRDWLNHPKANGYQALHVTLMSNQGRWIEVQIRSERMDDLAEKGFAAHWKYKEGKGEANNEGELNNWIGTIKEILDDPQPDAMDFLDAIKLNLFASEIFVFTPKGEIKTMPSGATALDFAFSIHSFLGTHCIGAKVNHKLVPLSYKLQSGDQVEILTSASQKVRADWLGIVTTTKASNKIRIALRRESRELQRKGTEMLNSWLKDKGFPASVSLYDRISREYEMTREDLLTAIAKGGIAFDDRFMQAVTGKQKRKRWSKLEPFLRSDKKKEQAKETEKFVVGKDFDKKKAVSINDVNFHTFNYASCCKPIAGDDILGFITDAGEIVIHKRNCEVATRLKSTYGDRIVDAVWNMFRGMLFDAAIQVKGFDRKGILKDVSRVLSDQMDIDIRDISLATKDGIFSGTILVRVYDREEVTEIADSLRRISDIKEVNML